MFIKDYVRVAVSLTVFTLFVFVVTIVNSHQLRQSIEYYRQSSVKKSISSVQDVIGLTTSSATIDDVIYIISNYNSEYSISVYDSSDSILIRLKPDDTSDYREAFTSADYLKNILNINNMLPTYTVSVTQSDTSYNLIEIKQNMILGTTYNVEVNGNEYTFTDNTKVPRTYPISFLIDSISSMPTDIVFVVDEAADLVYKFSKDGTSTLPLDITTLVQSLTLSSMPISNCWTVKLRYDNSTLSEIEFKYR